MTATPFAPILDVARTRLGAAALEALSRFRMMADGLNVEHRDAVATAAARDASNGAEFIRRAEAAWGRPIRILAGEDEARIAAEGVVAGIPEADGLAADLGGMPRPIRDDPIPYAPVYSWTGLYVGTHAGYAWSDVDWQYALAPGAASNQSSSGWLLGGQAG